MNLSQMPHGCILFLVDHSSSMVAPFGPTKTITKAEVVARELNGIVHCLGAVLRSLTQAPVALSLLERIHIGVIGYGNDVASALEIHSAAKDLVTVPQLLEAYSLVQDSVHATTDAHSLVPILKPRADGPTPMCEVLHRATTIVAAWIKEHPASPPPVVVNITDGVPTDGDPRAPAQQLIYMRTSLGNTLLCNHVFAASDAKLAFPEESGHWEIVFDPNRDPHVRLMFEICSVVPDKLKDRMRSRQFEPIPNCWLPSSAQRCLVVNYPSVLRLFVADLLLFVMELSSGPEHARLVVDEFLDCTEGKQRYLAYP